LMRCGKELALGSLELACKMESLEILAPLFIQRCAFPLLG
jgi:hypothetical protein